MACPFGGLLSERVPLDNRSDDCIEDGGADGAANGSLWVASDGIEDSVLGSEDDSSVGWCHWWLALLVDCCCAEFLRMTDLMTA